MKKPCKDKTFTTTSVNTQAGNRVTILGTPLKVVENSFEYLDVEEDVNKEVETEKKPKKPINKE